MRKIILNNPFPRKGAANLLLFAAWEGCRAGCCMIYLGKWELLWILAGKLCQLQISGMLWPQGCVSVMWCIKQTQQWILSCISDLGKMLFIKMKSEGKNPLGQETTGALISHRTQLALLLGMLCWATLTAPDPVCRFHHAQSD